MTKQDGYYWYFPADGETIPDLTDIQIVQIFDSGSRVALCGSDVTYDIDECTGQFIGPLLDPVTVRSHVK